MLASMAERKQYRGNHAANLILFYQYSMQKSKMLHLKGRIFEVTRNATFSPPTLALLVFSYLRTTFLDTPLEKVQIKFGFLLAYSYLCRHLT